MLHLMLFLIVFMFSVYCFASSCLCFGYVWEGVKIAFLKCVFYFVSISNFEGNLVMGVIGINHPWIGQKWPSVGKGLQLDPNGVESLRSMRRGKEDRVLWAPIRQHEPCGFLEFLV